MNGEIKEVDQVNANGIQRDSDDEEEKSRHENASADCFEIKEIEMEGQEDNGKFKCHSCDETFSDVSDLRRHFLVHSTDKHFKSEE